MTGRRRRLLLSGEYRYLISQRRADFHCRNNPNQKVADLISFDAFDDEPASSSSGGVTLPADNIPSTSNVGMTTSGLPLDLFAPSPVATPSPAGSSTVGAAGQKQKQDPMAFFNTASPQPASAFGGLGGLQQPTPNMNNNDFGFGGFQASQSSSPAVGYSLSPQPAAVSSQQFIQPQQPQQYQSQQQPQQQQQQQQQAKKDAFADLVDLMS